MAQAFNLKVMSKIPIIIGGKTYYMEEETWKKEEEWRKQMEKELPKIFRKALGKWN